MTDQQRNELLGNPFVRAIDAYFSIHRKILSLLLPPNAVGLIEEEHSALSTWLMLLTERLTSMVAAELVPLYQQIDDLEKRIVNLETMMRVGDDIDDPTGTM